MTRKHFIAVAAIMRGCQPSSMEESHANWVHACCDLADLFKKENPRFDRNKFLDACGIAT